MLAQVASITPLGEWLHDYKKGDTNSRMQLRQLLQHRATGKKHGQSRSCAVQLLRMLGATG